MGKLFGLLVMMSMGQTVWSMNVPIDTSLKDYLTYCKGLSENELQSVKIVEVAINEKLKTYSSCDINCIRPFLVYQLGSQISPWVVKKSETQEGKKSIKNYISNISQKYFFPDESIFLFLKYLCSFDDSQQSY